MFIRSIYGKYTGVRARRVLVYKLDRFSRNKYETAIHKKTLKDNGVKLVSAMENIPDSPEGIILESLLEGMNQYYSAECFYGHNTFPAAICMASRLAPAAKNLSFTQIVTATQQG